MRTAVLRNGMLLSFVVYLPALLLLQRLLGNHGIWAALLVLMAMRGILLTLAWPRLRDSVGSHCIKQAAVACCGSAIISAQSAWMVTLNKEESAALQASIRQVSQRVAAELQARPACNMPCISSAICTPASTRL
jgi:thiol:disulfide interchange protein